MKEIQRMKLFNFTIGILIAFLLSTPIFSQSMDQDDEDNTLITIHAEDAFLPSILAILAKESG